MSVSIFFAFVINAKKENKPVEAVEVAKFIAQKTPNHKMLEVAKFKAQKNSKCAQWQRVVSIWKYIYSKTVNGIKNTSVFVFSVFVKKNMISVFKRQPQQHYISAY